jgi:transposase
MKFNNIIGADISKKTIDLFCHGLHEHLKISNDVEGFKKMQRWLNRLKMVPAQSVIVMEHTGFYSFHFENYLHQNGIRFSKVSALAIKKSLGLVRGKTDKIDALRIARYGYEKQDLLVPETRVDATLQTLQILNSARNLLVKQRASLLCSVKEYGAILPENDPIIQTQLKLISGLAAEIIKLEKRMTDLLKKPGPIGKNFKLLIGIKGIGLIVATATLIKTNNFTRFKNRKKFSCYCGSAPFEYSSGTSIRKKTKVNHQADKTMKTLLTQSAKTAIQHDKELKAFYERRTQMGKSKRSTINVVRNKLIYRMFAVIKRQTPFIAQYQKTA